MKNDYLRQLSQQFATKAELLRELRLLYNSKADLLQAIQNEAVAFITSISIAPASAAIIEGTSRQFTVTAHFADGSSEDVTSRATFTSSDSNIVAVNNTGLATGISLGPEITARLQRFTATAIVDVQAAVVMIGLTIQPASAVITDGDSQQLTVTGHFSDGSMRNFTHEATYISSDPGIVAVDNNGLATGISPGTAEITAKALQFTATARIAVPGLTIQPASIVIQTGDSQQFTVTAHFADGSSRDVTPMATYTSSKTTLVSINSSGLAAGLAPGSARITAAYYNFSAEASLEIKSPAGFLVDPVAKNLYRPAIV